MATLSELEKRLDELEDRIEATQTRLAGINSCTCNEEQVKQSINSLALRLTALENMDGESTSETTEEMQQAIETLQTQVSANNQAIGALQTALDSLQTELGAMQDRIDDLAEKSEVEALQALVTNLQAQNEEFAAEIARLKLKVSECIRGNYENGTLTLTMGE